jgi:hypothetical protein
MRNRDRRGTIAGRAKFTAISGRTASGKTTVAIKYLAEMARIGWRTAFFKSNEIHKVSSTYRSYMERRCLNASDVEQAEIHISTFHSSLESALDKCATTECDVAIFDYDEQCTPENMVLLSEGARRFNIAIIATVGTWSLANKIMCNPDYWIQVEKTGCDGRSFRIVKSGGGEPGFERTIPILGRCKDPEAYPIVGTEEEGYYDDGENYEVVDSPKLLPCPFCGCGCTVIKTETGYHWHGIHEPCVLDEMTGARYGKADSVAEEWNHRAKKRRGRK